VTKKKSCLCGGCPCHAGRDAAMWGEMPLFKNILFIQEARKVYEKS
jgi:hypothetical protein